MVENLDGFELRVVVVSFLSVKSGGFWAVAFGRDDDEMTGGRFARKVLHLLTSSKWVAVEKMLV